MKVEYLVVVIKKHGICTTTDSFTNYLKSNPNITINAKKITYRDKLEVSYSLQDGQIKKEESLFFHLTLICKNDENIEIFSEFLRKIRDLMSGIKESKLQTLRDDITLYYSEKAYSVIHKLENMMRKLITKFMVITVGNQWASNTFPDDFKVPSSHNNVNLLHGADFIQLSSFLFDSYKTLETEKLINKINSLDTCTSDDLKELKCFVPKSNWERYFYHHVNCSSDFLSKRWEKLYALRCLVAHNNVFHKAKYDQLLQLAKEVSEKLAEAIKELDKIIVPDNEKENIAEGYAISINEVTGSFINSWKEIESTLSRIYSNKLNGVKHLPPHQLINILHEQDIIDDSTHEELNEFRKLRNSIVHGVNSDLPMEHIKNSITKLKGISSKSSEILCSDNYFWLNSNKKYSGDSWKKMLSQSVACTYGDEKYGKLLEKIKIGDFILLYLSEEGIIGGGVVTEEYKNKANIPPLTIDSELAQEMPEYSIGVNWKFKLVPNLLLTIKDIRLLGQNHFMGTLFRVQPKTGIVLFEELQKKTGSPSSSVTSKVMINN